MSNPARDLLNYVDDHKEEMKDDTYKGIVDRLAPINKIVECKNKCRYKVFFLVTNIRCDPDDDSLCKADYDNRNIEVYLSTPEVKFINKRLDEYGNINQIWEHSISD